MLTTITAGRTALADDITPTLALRNYLAGLGVGATLIVSATVLASLGAELLFG